VAVQDVTERTQMEVELRHGQKLQAVGALASGIAHEINTPIQFVGDNVRFLHDAFADLIALLETHEQSCDTIGAQYPEELRKQIQAAREAADIQFLRKEIPAALNQTLDGVGRVATIVQALKKFSHVEWGNEKIAANLNDAIESTLVVARNELKYVADVETSFADLPPLLCHLGDLNQVFLNLLVNAAHSIGEVVTQTGKKGKIRVETREEGDSVVVAISDTGAGIPPEIRSRIFEPFFTTKGVGKGSGQGLALARAIVVEKHGGNLTFESEVGKGSTFYIRIPINGTANERAEAAI
jgi:signal transduction histidine kinase